GCAPCASWRTAWRSSRSTVPAPWDGRGSRSPTSWASVDRRRTRSTAADDDDVTGRGRPVAMPAKGRAHAVRPTHDRGEDGTRPSAGPLRVGGPHRSVGADAVALGALLVLEVTSGDAGGAIDVSRARRHMRSRLSRDDA